MNPKLRFRLVLCGHKAAEVAAICLPLMVQGHVSEVTLAHFVIASKTGFWAIFPALGLSFTQHARHLANRWTSSLIAGVGAFLADSLAHKSHYPGEYTEAALTAAGAVVLSLVISMTPVGKRIDRLAEECLAHQAEAIDETPAAARGDSD